MSLICLSHLRLSHFTIKSKLILMVIETLCGLGPACLSHFTSFCSARLVVICLHWLSFPCNDLFTLPFCFSQAGHHVQVCRLCAASLQEGHSVGFGVNDDPRIVQHGSQAHTCQARPHLLILLPGTSTCGLCAHLLHVIHKKHYSISQSTTLGQAELPA